MNKWFYAKDGQAIGPLSTPEMHELIGQGACTRTTLVWTRGMRDWLPACMAAWMWEERAERAGGTTEAQGEPDGEVVGAAAASGGASTTDSANEMPVVPSQPRAERRTPAAASIAADANQGSTAESTDAGVVGMVRKLFGLG
jgi:hypothetical protein